MKICMYVRRSELEYLYKILKDTNVFKEQIDISAVPFVDSLMVSIDYDNYVRLDDAGVFSVLISL